MSLSDEAHAVIAKVWAELKSIEQEIVASPAVQAAASAIESDVKAAGQTILNAAVAQAENVTVAEVAAVTAKVVAGVAAAAL